MQKNNNKELFDKNGFVFIKNATDKMTCDFLSDFAFGMIKNGHGYSDEQVPTAMTIKKNQVFSLLNLQMREKIEAITGLELYPTYSYARVYKKGDELKHHVDREACEISATLTLGFSHSPWPIFMADGCDQDADVTFTDPDGEEHGLKNISAVIMEQSDMVVYKGEQKIHWREPLSGSVWHAQVFLHYVDANGPYKDKSEYRTII